IGGPSEQLHVVVGEWRLRCRGTKMGCKDIRIFGIEDAGLGGLAKKRSWVVEEVGVQRVVARHQHGQRTLRFPAGSPDLLPERGAGPWEPGDQHSVQPGAVKAKPPPVL